MWYWCQKHEKVESEARVCGATTRLGPYPTEEAAADWNQTSKARNDAWEEEDERWEGGDA